jgi:hypothetical protein
MKRRYFIEISTKATLGLLIVSRTTAFPTLQKYLFDTFEGSDEEYRRLLLVENAAESYKTSDTENILKTFNTHFWINFGESGKDGSFKEATRVSISSAKPVNFDDVRKACNWESNPVISDVMPRLNDIFWDVILTTGGFSAVAGIAKVTRSPFHALVASAAISGTLILNKELIKGIFEKVEKDNVRLCVETVNKYDKNLKNQDKELLESDSVSNQIQVPFKKDTDDIEKSLPPNNRLIKAKDVSRNPAGETVHSVEIQGESKKKILQNTINDLDAYLAEWKDQIAQVSSEKERQMLIAQINFQNEENKASIYLVRTFIDLVLGDKSFASDFYKIAMALNDMHYNFAQFTMPIPSIGTMAFTANWIGASLMIMSVLEGSNEGDTWKELFKQLRELTEIVIEGFKAVQENQKRILEQLNNLYEAVIRNGVIEQSILTQINTGMREIQQSIDMLEYGIYMNKIENANSQLNALFNDNFNINKESHQNEYRKNVTEFVTHATLSAANVRTFSGYVTSADGTIVKSIINQNIPFEYQIGLIPVVHNRLSHIYSTVRPGNYMGVVPNPIEWIRGVDLYLQAYFFAKPASQYVKNHVKELEKKGRLLSDFLKDYSSQELFIPLKSSFTLLTNRLSEGITANFQIFLKSKSFPTIIDTLNDFRRSGINQLDRNVFSQVNLYGTQRSNWDLERDILLGRFNTSKYKYYVNEFDTFHQNEPLYTLDYDIYGLINLAAQLNIVSYAKTAADRGYDPSFYFHTLTFISGPFKGLEIKFADATINVAGRPHLGPFYSFPGITFSLIKLRYKGRYESKPVPKKIANYSWREKAQELRIREDIAVSYFKLEPSYKNVPNDSSLSAFPYTFPEFLLNEVLNKADEIKHEAIQDLKLNTTLLYNKFSEDANNFNMIGYLLMNILAINNYNLPASIFKDYGEIKMTGLPFRNTPIALPFISLFDDIVSQCANIASEDFLSQTATLNDRGDWSQFMDGFKSSAGLNTISNFIIGRITKMVEKQNVIILELINDSPKEQLNFNIASKLALLELLKKELDK